MERDGSNAAMRFLYGNPVGRAMIKVMLAVKAPKVMAWYLHTPFSKGMIRRYIRKYNISMKGYPRIGYRSFSDFFERRKIKNSFDPEPNHFISPCDGHLSAYPISTESVFAIKGSSYRVSDLVDDAILAGHFGGGQALVFRLAPNDYHHYCFIDDGFVHDHQFKEGQLHSVQPIALANVPVFRLNRRCRTLIETDNFGPVIQVEVGALAVGGIVNERENETVKKGETMGHFSLMGSTIVLLLEKGRMELNPAIAKVLATGTECPVKMGEWIGEKIDS